MPDIKKIVIIHSLFCEVSSRRTIHLHFADTMKEFVEVGDHVAVGKEKHMYAIIVYV